MRVEGLWKDYKKGRKSLNGKEDRGVVKKYKELVNEKNSLFDMSTSDPTRIKVVSRSGGGGGGEGGGGRGGVKMFEMEYIYLEDQRGERRMEFNTG